MHPVLLLARRNLRRNRARSGLTFCAIAGGVGITLVLAGFNQGLQDATRGDFVLRRSGALQVHRSGYFELRDSPPVDPDMPATGPFVDAMAAVPGVAHVAPRLVFQALLAQGERGHMCLVRGIDPGRERAVLPWGWEHPGGAGSAWVGDLLAAALHLGPGDRATLQATTPHGQMEALDIGVASTVASTEVDSRRLVEVPLALAQALLHRPGRATEFIVAVRDQGALPEVAAALRRYLGPGYEVATWEELDPNIVDMLRLLNVVVDAIGLVSLVIVSFGVVNAMRMSVRERTREIGTMMAMGVRRATICGMFLAEALQLAALATVAGVAAAWAFEGLCVAAGGFTMAPAQGATAVAMMPHVPAMTVAVTAVCAILGAAGAAAYPAYRAAQLRPVEALQAL